HRAFVPGETSIPLQAPSYGHEEVIEVLDSLLSTNVTMGKKVHLFEEAFAEYLGVKHAVMVNSGSSANLVALSVLTNDQLPNRIMPGEEIIVPATLWTTTINPIGDVGAVPVVVDVELGTMNIDPAKVEEAVNEKTRAIMPVHLLGNPAKIKEITRIATEHNLFIIEDTCEAHGAMVGNKKVGTFGDIGTFSFFFSHHISTIEGGMVVTDNDEYAELARALRAFGWARNLKKYESYAAQYPQIDKRFLFVNKGFNLRPTELQGAMGMHQIKKLEKHIAGRRQNAAYWITRLRRFSGFLILHEEREGTRHVWFGQPLTVKDNAPFTRDELVEYLEEHRIETRPVLVPNIEQQPYAKMIKHRVHGELRNAQYIADHSFFLGNHQQIGKQEREYVADVIADFIKRKARQ
ncbi:MAG TPA: aminotransferase class I/II-fold pyridoxal phosphate-dependent enzyme, partial [Candidatus Hodarchaeales archaeon]|nr:aminotransferase class I/II-fold pyridoxal phosphate-dependent enzyme [Candidatus Hodarchaeales archaeon]